MSRITIHLSAVLLLIASSMNLLHGKSPVKEGAPSPNDTIVVFFPVSCSDAAPYIEKHQAEMDRFMAAILELHQSGQLECVQINGYACLIGPHDRCVYVAGKRAASLAGYISAHSGIPSSLITVNETDIAWKRLFSLVEGDTKVPMQDEVLKTLQDTPLWIFDKDGRVVDGRKKRLMEIDYGRAFVYMRDNFFPKMRYASAYIVLRQDETQSTDEDSAVAATLPEMTATTAADSLVHAADNAVYEEPKTCDSVASDKTATAAAEPPSPYSSAGKETGDEQFRVRLKTNIPYWALVIPNIGVETRLGDRWSLDVPVFFSPYTVDKAYRFRIFSVQPGVRYWFSPDMNGHFIGLHLIGGAFNISVNDRLRYQDTDGAWGAGIDYGYELKFSRHWGMEFNIGIGYLWTRYETFYNIDNGASCGTSVLNYFGITRLGISLIYEL